MQLHIIAVGHKMPDWIESGIHEYTKRMPRDCQVVIKEVKPVERSGSKTAETVMALEKTKIEAAIPKGAFIVALDEHGIDLTTVQLAKHLTHWQRDGHSNVALIIGGADGLDAEFKKSAQLLIRLSSLTLPHGMVRLLLSEQLYRAWSITQNHPYHRV